MAIRWLSSTPDTGYHFCIAHLISKCLSNAYFALGSVVGSGALKVNKIVPAFMVPY